MTSLEKALQQPDVIRALERMLVYSNDMEPRKIKEFRQPPSKAGMVYPAEEVEVTCINDFERFGVLRFIRALQAAGADWEVHTCPPALLVSQ